MDIWLVVGFCAQGLFSLRFIVQWIASEKQKKSVVPVYFWYISIAGGAMLLAYAIHRKDPVFILGQSMGILVYSRNLMLIHGWRLKPKNAGHSE
ncbi:MAG: lipid-A-disaccharide synthase N-terminal domain-containing protein [bacterium]